MILIECFCYLKSDVVYRIIVLLFNVLYMYYYKLVKIVICEIF